MVRCHLNLHRQTQETTILCIGYEYMFSCTCALAAIICTYAMYGRWMSTLKLHPSDTLSCIWACIRQGTYLRGTEYLCEAQYVCDRMSCDIQCLPINAITQHKTSLCSQNTMIPGCTLLAVPAYDRTCTHACLHSQFRALSAVSFGRIDFLMMLQIGDQYVYV